MGCSTSTLGLLSQGAIGRLVSQTHSEFVVRAVSLLRDFRPETSALQEERENEETLKS